MATGMKKNNARIREEQTEHILEAARLLFAHKGYSDTTMTDIAAAAKISYGLAYHYFKDKGEIFTKVIEEALHSSMALMQYVRQMPGTPWEHLQWLTTRMLEGAQHQPEAFMVVMQAFTNDAIPEKAREFAWQSGTVSLETFKQMIIEARKVMSCAILCARPLRAEPVRKTIKQIKKMGLRPNRSESLPYIGIVTVMVSK